MRLSKDEQTKERIEMSPRLPTLSEDTNNALTAFSDKGKCFLEAFIP